MKPNEFMERVNEEVRKLSETEEFKSNYTLQYIWQDGITKYSADPLFVGVNSWGWSGEPKCALPQASILNKLVSIGLINEIEIHPNRYANCRGGVQFYRINWGVFRDFSGISKSVKELEQASFGEPYGAIFAPPLGIKTDFKTVTGDFDCPKGDICHLFYEDYKKRGIVTSRKGWSLDPAVKHIFREQTFRMLNFNYQFKD